jgi:S1-C subfamily serine protease
MLAQLPPTPVAQGVVDVTLRVEALHAEAAGTGMLLDGSGHVLTNNHVIRGGTRIRVTMPGSRRYRARVLGANADKDVALLQLVGTPPALAPVRLGDSSKASIGDLVTAVGNAGGVGGTPSAAPGIVTALDQSITAQDGASSEHLKGLIETNAPIRPGDSGGPLLDATDSVIGMDTAAASGLWPREGFAIPINRAVAIVQQIMAGHESRYVHIGPSRSAARGKTGDRAR